MIWHYIKFAFRSLFRDKIFSLINILGLTIGLTGAFVVSIYVINELSFDKHYAKKDRIYSVNTQWTTSTNIFAQSSYMVSETFKQEFPETESVVTLYNSWRSKVKIKEDFFSEKVYFSSNELFQIFELEIVKGNALNPLNELKDIVLSEKTANKLFGDTEPIGKTITLMPKDKEVEFIVTAIIKDQPWNSSYTFDFIANLDFEKRNYKSNDQEWHRYYFDNFILLKEGSNPNLLQDKITEFCKTKLPKDIQQTYLIQPFNDIYLKSSNYHNVSHKTGDLSQIKLLLFIGLLLLFISTSNYTIMSTAKAINRIREISMRKIIGATQKNIFKQIGWESAVLCILIIPFTLILAYFIVPYASLIMDTSVEIQPSNLPFYILSFIGLIFLIVISSGLYIALYTSRFNPLNAFRGLSSSTEIFIGRKIMITFQIVIFIGLLISVFVVSKQIDYSKNMDLGFDKNNLYLINTPSMDESSRNAFVHELYSNPNIIDAAFSLDGPPTNSFQISIFNTDSVNKFQVEVLSVDFNFLKTLKVKLNEGRYFQKDYADSDSTVCIINETAVKELSLKNPINHLIGKTKVIGVIKDFHLHTSRNKVAPLLIVLGNNNNRLYVRISSDNKSQTMDFINNKWTKFYPNKEFIINSIDNLQDRRYQNESKFARNLTIFASIAIFLSIIGLFGLTLFTIEKRSKEIGIRKVHGASINNIMMMINKEFALLVGIATIIAWPVAWYFMDKWLQNFAYTIKLPIELYVLSGLAAMFIVLLTVSIRSLKAAMSNPVEALKYE